jgi:hypothetical protein
VKGRVVGRERLVPRPTRLNGSHPSRVASAHVRCQIDANANERVRMGNDLWQLSSPAEALNVVFL